MSYAITFATATLTASNASLSATAMSYLIAFQPASLKWNGAGGGGHGGGKFRTISNLSN